MPIAQPSQRDSALEPSDLADLADLVDLVDLVDLLDLPGFYFFIAPQPAQESLTRGRFGASAKG